MNRKGITNTTLVIGTATVLVLGTAAYFFYPKAKPNVENTFVNDNKSNLVTPQQNVNFKISDDKKTVYLKNTESAQWQVLLTTANVKNSFGIEDRTQADEFTKVFSTPDNDKVIISACSACTADTNVTWQFIYDIVNKTQTQIAGNGVVGFSPNSKLILTSSYSDGAGFVTTYSVVDFITTKSLGDIRTSDAQGKLGNQIAEFVKSKGIKIQDDFVPYTIGGFSQDSQLLVISTPNDAFYKYQWKFTTDFRGENLQLLSQSEMLPLKKLSSPTFKSFKTYLEGYREGGDWTNEFNSVVNIDLVSQAQNIYRSTSRSGPWELVWISKPFYRELTTSEFKDILLPARSQKVFYKVNPINSLGEEGPDSDVLEVTIPASDAMTATAFICKRGLDPNEKRKGLDFLPIRVSISDSPQIATEIMNGLMNFEVKNVPSWYYWLNIFNYFPKGAVKLDSFVIQDKVALVKFSDQFEFSQREPSTQECIKGQIKNTLDQFTTIKKLELYWNNTKVYESQTFGGNVFLRFQFAKQPNY